MKPKLLLMAMVLLLTACDGLEARQGADSPVAEAGEKGTLSTPESSGHSAIRNDPESTQIDQWMAQDEPGPGGVVMVVQSGEIVHQQGYGLADVDQGIPITPETRFHLGSVGKQFTAMGVLMLVDQGQVALDDPISAHIPELDWMDEGVTVRRLLHHTSGVMGYDDSDDIYDALLNSSSTPGNEDVVTAISQFQEMLFDPGEEFHYSNTGYDLLGLLIERISGQTYGQFMEDSIFAPLGMRNTFALPSDERFGPSVAQSYDADGPYEPDILDNVNGSGSLYSTLGDLYLYNQAWSTETLVSQDLLAEMVTSGTLRNGEETDYGFGVEVYTYGDYDYVAHQGAWLGFDSYYLRFPEESLTIVVLLNLDYAEQDAETMAFAIADLYLP
ncbi:MAG: serine hydrolase domain-containing protein [Spirulina sp.]